MEAYQVLSFTDFIYEVRITEKEGSQTSQRTNTRSL